MVWCKVILVLCFPMLVLAQGNQTDNVGVRDALYEPTNNERKEVTVLDPVLRPFYHGVASGDPLPDRVILWTRVTPENGEATIAVQWQIATDTAFTNIVGSGSVEATADKDYTVKVDASGLQPGTVYFYNFTTYDRNSLTGRTRTTAATSVAQTVKLGIVSCSNYPAGFFNAYATLAARNDIDAVLHLGDYIYEYSADSASLAGSTGIFLGRSHEPSHEIVQLTDYRARYAQYRLDPDLRRVHQQFPMIHVWDDHEAANNAHAAGAQNHQPGTEGDWLTRLAISKRVCMEWMPTREQPEGNIYRAFQFGSVADVFMIDTRLDGRDKQVAGVGANASQESKDSLYSPTRKMMSAEQFDWITTRLQTSQARWKVLGNQVMFSPVTVTPIDTAYLFNAVGPLFAGFLRPQMPAVQAIFENAFGGDVWSNYPAQREALTDFIRNNHIENVVIATGDFHTAFAFNTETLYSPDTTSVAVEFMTPSISSPNFDENLKSNPLTAPIMPALVATVDQTLNNLNPHMKLRDLVHHGYIVLTLDENQTHADYFYVDTLLIRSHNERFAAGFSVASGTPLMNTTSAPAENKPIQDIPAPLLPRRETSVSESTSTKALTVLGFGPNPAHSTLFVQYISSTQGVLDVYLVTVDGKKIVVNSTSITPGLHSIVADVSKLASAQYSMVLQLSGTSITLPITITH